MSQDTYGRHYESFHLDEVPSPLCVAKRLEPRSCDTPPYPRVARPQGCARLGVMGGSPPSPKILTLT